MSTDEKIAEILFYLSLRSTMEVSNVIDLCKIQRCDDTETQTIIQTLESEGYASNVPNYDYGYMAVTELGKQVGRSRTYLDLVDQRKKWREKQPERQDCPPAKKALDRQYTLQVQLTLACSGLVVAMIGLCAFLQNRQLRASRDTMDSLRKEIRLLRGEVQTRTFGLRGASSNQIQSASPY